MRTLAKIRRLKKEKELRQAAIAPGGNWSKYADDPIGFCADILGKSLTPDQCRIAEAVRDRNHIVVPSAHGQGKTAIAAWLVLWWIYAMQGLAITSAPTLRQVKELLWGEIRKARGNLPGRTGMLFVELSESARAFGFSSADADPNSFQGLHAERLLIVLDEACGISPDVADGAIACVTGSGNKILEIGNPVVPDSPFHAHSLDRANATIRLPAWRHPNVSWAYEQHADGIHRLKPEVARAIADGQGGILPQRDWPEDLPRDSIPGAISIEWIERVRRTHGEGSPYWQSRVEAEFPTDAASSVIPRTWFAAARARYDADPDKWSREAERHIPRYGLDVGDGGDPHALSRWRGPVLNLIQERATLGDREDVSRAAAWARSHIRQHERATVAVDQVGVGAGALSILKGENIPATAFNWGHGATDAEQFLNHKAEQFWALREALRKEEVAIAPLGEFEEALATELAAIRYEFTVTGKLRIEDKAKTIKRLGHSPNLADAAVGGFSARSGRARFLELRKPKN